MHGRKESRVPECSDAERNLMNREFAFIGTALVGGLIILFGMSFFMGWGTRLPMAW